LLISMTNGEIERGESIRMDFPDTELIEVPLSSASRKAGAAIRPADTALRRIPGEITSSAPLSWILNEPWQPMWLTS